MTVIYGAATQGNRMQTTMDDADAQGAGLPAEIWVGTLGMTIVLAKYVLSYPSFTRVGPVITGRLFPKLAVGIGTGDAVSAILVDGLGNIIMTDALTVGTLSPEGEVVTDVVLNNTNIRLGQETELTSAVFTHAGAA